MGKARNIYKIRDKTLSKRIPLTGTLNNVSKVVHVQGFIKVRSGTRLNGRVFYRVTRGKNLLLSTEDKKEALAFCNGANIIGFVNNHTLEGIVHSSFVTGKTVDELLNLFVTRGINRLKYDNYKIS